MYFQNGSLLVIVVLIQINGKSPKGTWDFRDSAESISDMVRWDQEQLMDYSDLTPGYHSLLLRSFSFITCLWVGSDWSILGFILKYPFVGDLVTKNLPLLRRWGPCKTLQMSVKTNSVYPTSPHDDLLSPVLRRSVGFFVLIREVWVF